MSKKTKVLLIQPITMFSNYFDYANTPVTQLLHIATYLKHIQFPNDQNLEVRVINLLDENLRRMSTVNDLDRFLKDFEQWLIQFNDGSDLIFGISCFSSNYYISSIILAQTIRRIYPKAIICVGGYHVNFYPDDFIFPRTIMDAKFETKLFDYIFLGEAEVKFSELVAELINHNQVGSNFEKPCQVINCGPICDLNMLPPTDYSLMKYENTPIIHVATYFSRGCPHNCNFCADYRNVSPEFSHKRWRLVSPDYAFEQTKQIAHYFDSINQDIQIQIVDPLFTYPEWRKNYYDKLVGINFKHELWAETRIDQFSLQQELEPLKKLNFVLAFGVESGSLEILRIMNKTNHPQSYLEKVPSIMSELNRIGTYVITNFMIGHPGETQKTLNETFKYAEMLYKDATNGIPSFSKYIITPCSEIFFNLEKYREKYGTHVHHPLYWLIPACHFTTASMVDASSELGYLDVISQTIPWITNFIRDVRNKFQLFGNRDLIYERYRSHFSLFDLPFWSQISRIYKSIPPTHELDKIKVDFWEHLALIENNTSKFVNSYSSQSIKL
jgi:radical SAM superfamily enzyme YgiQ (UPF0313 family)